MNNTSENGTNGVDTNKWCSRFDRCKGCRLDAECQIRPEELAIVFENGRPVDKWDLRISVRIREELLKEAP